jgi:hypothetical protein
MEVKDLFDPGVRNDIVNRVNALSATSTPLWGKMNVSQMLAHCQMPLGVALGKHQLKSNLIAKLLGPLFRKQLSGPKPFSKNLPTDKSFVMTGTVKDFEKEKAALLEMIQSFKEENLSGQPHPFFGKLTNIEWSRGNWKHLDHHLQQFGV